MLSLENEVSVSDMPSFNTGSILEHEQGAEPEGGFPISNSGSGCISSGEIHGVHQHGKG